MGVGRKFGDWFWRFGAAAGVSSVNLLTQGEGEVRVELEAC